ncbi:MAG TPA: hypothetical protein VG860_04365 [Terriglobia bacterium]|nr:hypothetical protein [Terriglobia bacterium]
MPANILRPLNEYINTAFSDKTPLSSQPDYADTHCLQEHSHGKADAETSKTSPSARMVDREETIAITPGAIVLSRGGTTSPPYSPTDLTGEIIDRMRIDHPISILSDILFKRTGRDTDYLFPRYVHDMIEEHQVNFLLGFDRWLLRNLDKCKAGITQFPITYFAFLAKSNPILLGPFDVSAYASEARSQAQGAPPAIESGDTDRPDGLNLWRREYLRKKYETYRSAYWSAFGARDIESLSKASDIIAPEEWDQIRGLGIDDEYFTDW